MEYTAAVVTVSDKGAQGLREDRSGPAVCALLEQAGWKVTATALRLVITSCRLEPYMDIFQPYAFNGKVPSRPLTDRISAYIRNIGQKAYYKKLERQNAKKEG